MSPAEEAIERFLSIFGEPKTLNPEKFLDEYRKALTGIEASVLETAVDRIMKTATFWPKPAEVIQKAKDVASDKYAARGIDWDAIEEERKQGWKFNDLRKGEVGEAQKARVQAMVDEMKRNIASRTLDDVDPLQPDWKRGQRDGFEAMQRNSPNVGLHRERKL